MKNVLGFMVGVVVTAAVALVQLHVSLLQVATLAAGLAALAWLLVVLVLPWNLVFQARRVVSEAARSRARGLVVEQAQVDEAQRVYARTWRLAIALHVGTAALLGLGAAVWGEPLAAVFAGLFLVSTVGRPAVVVYGELKRRLSQSLVEVAFPRDDVQTVRDEAQRQGLEVQRLQRAELAARERLDGLVAADLERRQQLEALAQRFERAVDQLTHDRELVAGLKAFVRLAHSTPR